MEISKRIASEYRLLADRFDDYAKRSTKPGHIAANLAAGHVQAGRLLRKAIEAGAFPNYRRKHNLACWDADLEKHSDGISFGGPIDESSDEECALAWVTSVGYLLVKKYPSRFGDKAAAWYWRHVATDEGIPIETKGRTLKWRWLNKETGKLLPEGTTLHDIYAMDNPEHYAGGLDGDSASVTDFYNSVSWHEQTRIQAKVDSRACIVLAELLESPDDATQFNLEILARIIENGAKLRRMHIMQEADESLLRSLIDDFVVGPSRMVRTSFNALKRSNLRQDAKIAIVGVKRAADDITQMVELKADDTYTTYTLKFASVEWGRVFDLYHATLLAEADYVGAGSPAGEQVMPTQSASPKDESSKPFNQNNKPPGELVGPISKAAMARRMLMKNKAKWEAASQFFPDGTVHKETRQRFSFNISHLAEHLQQRARTPRADE